MKPGKLFLVSTSAFWLVMMGLLARGHIAASKTDQISAILRFLRNAPSSSSWFGIYEGGKKIGYTQVVISAEPVKGEVIYAVQFHARLVSPETAFASGEFSFSDPGGTAVFSLSYRAGGRLMCAGGSADRQTLRFSYDLGSPASSGGIRVPLSGFGDGSLRLENLGEEVIAVGGVLSKARRWTVAMGRGGGTFWIDDDGAVLRASLPGRIEIFREPEPLATKI